MFEAARLNKPSMPTTDRGGQLFASFILIVGAAVTFFLWILIDDNSWRININYRLLPWLGATALVMLAPTVYLLYRKKFDIFHPLVHASWSYWFPSIVVGGLFIATDLINPYPMSLLGNPESDLIWTCVYAMIGYVGMTIGFCLPIGRRAGDYAGRKLPAWDWKPNQVLLPAIAFFSVGLFFYVNSFLSGVIGVSITDAADAFSAVYFTLSFLSLEAGFLVALYIFKSHSIKPEHIVAFGLILLLLISRMSLGGNRSSMYLIVVLLTIAFAYSGRRMKMTTGAIFAGLAVLAVFGGMIYGTTFRSLKQTEEKIGLDEQIAMVSRTVDVISTQDTGKVLQDGFLSLAERIDGISSLGVVVSNYERLKPYESSYGLENNIVKDLWISFIPRFLWANKPTTSDPRAYSDLYFNFNGNSYAITPVGDLLRNYGSLGVPIGMLIVGIFLRFVYVMLIENQKVTIGRATAYFMFLVTLSYEGFYGTMFVYGGRILVIAFITLFIADLLLINKNVREPARQWRL
jgi:hypothetical protein